MEMLLTSLFLVLTAVLGLWTAVVGLQVFSAGSNNTQAEPVSGPRGTVAVVIPAHNEDLGIAGTIEDVRAQLMPRDRVIVVADNCSDDTARVANAHGAEVIERYDPSNRGKGFALEFGIRHLGTLGDFGQLPPKTVIIVDADCRVGPGSIERLAAVAQQTQRPVQALDLMLRPVGGSPFHGLSAFAWRVKNQVRPLGLKRLGLPCQLMGTGMAFPWELISAAKLGTAHVVEDLKLGLELAAHRHAPTFCPSAVVTSYFPLAVEGATTQRERWEGGHLQIIRTMAVPAMLSAIRARNRDLFVLALDASVPPLTLLGFGLALATVLTSMSAFGGLSAIPALVSGATLVSYLGIVVLSWHRFGRNDLPAEDLGGLPVYLLSKARLYRRLASGRGPSEWVRSERANSLASGQRPRDQRPGSPVE